MNEHAVEVWSDTEVFRARHEKSASALIAVQNALRETVLAGASQSEFLRLYRFCSELPSAVFTRLWQDPTAYFWARIAYDLVGHLSQGGALPPQTRATVRALAGEDANAALARHLDDFAAFALAGAVLAERSLELRQPWCARLPLALPGTRYQLSGEGRVRIAGHVAGGLVVLDERGRAEGLALRNGAAAAGVRVVLDPVLELDEHAVRLSAAPFQLPGFSFASVLDDCSADYHRRHRPLLEAAFELVRRHHPESYAQMAASLQVIGCKPVERGGFTNMTHSDLPGAYVLGLMDNPWELADTLIHEFYHNRLFFLEEVEAFFADEDQNAATDAIYYSPWRDDLRPLDGILHAVFVHLPVCDYWVSLLRDEPLEAHIRAFGMDRLVRYPVQIGLGLHQLRRYGRFSPAGERLVTELEQRLAEVRLRIAAVVQKTDVPACICNRHGEIARERSKRTGAAMTVMEALDEHIALCDTEGQCWDVPLERFAVL